MIFNIFSGFRISKDLAIPLNPSKSLKDHRKTTKGLNATTIRKYATLTTNVIINTNRESVNNVTPAPRTRNWENSLNILSTQDTHLYSTLSFWRLSWIRNTENPNHISGPLKSSDFGHIISKSLSSLSSALDSKSLGTFLQFFRKLFSQRSQTRIESFLSHSKPLSETTFIVTWRSWLWATICWGREETVAIRIVDKSTKTITINQLICTNTPPTKDCFMIFCGVESLDGERIKRRIWYKK